MSMCCISWIYPEAVNWVLSNLSQGCSTSLILTSALEDKIL